MSYRNDYGHLLSTTQFIVSLILKNCINSSIRFQTIQRGSISERVVFQPEVMRFYTLAVRSKGGRDRCLNGDPDTFWKIKNFSSPFLFEFSYILSLFQKQYFIFHRYISFRGCFLYFFLFVLYLLFFFCILRSSTSTLSSSLIQTTLFCLLFFFFFFLPPFSAKLFRKDCTAFRVYISIRET